MRHPRQWNRSRRPGQRAVDKPARTANPLTRSYMAKLYDHDISKPAVNAAVEANLARAQARSDIASIAG